MTASEEALRYGSLSLKWRIFRHTVQEVIPNHPFTFDTWILFHVHVFLQHLRVVTHLYESAGTEYVKNGDFPRALEKDLRGAQPNFKTCVMCYE